MAKNAEESNIRILGIESSCDETAAAVVENGRHIISNVVATQIDIHKKYGGVFPEVASRQHVLSVMPVIEECISKAHLTYPEIDAIAVTRGPGLAGSLIVGMNGAKGLALSTDIPIIGVNHLEGHIYSAWLTDPALDQTEWPAEPEFPAIILLVSGGHSEIILLKSHLHYQRLGGTLDDAAGEAFDKVARIIGLEYPGGPSIQKAAENGEPKAFRFPRSWLKDSWDFSFSGLKTAVLRTVQELNKDGVSELPVADLAASFQQSVVDVLFEKTIHAANAYHARSIIIAGGVSANKALRDAFTSQTDFPLFIPRLSYCTDNAAMIASAGYQRYVHGLFDDLKMDIYPSWPLSRVSLPD